MPQITPRDPDLLDAVEPGGCAPAIAATPKRDYTFRQGDPSRKVSRDDVWDAQANVLDMLAMRAMSAADIARLTGQALDTVETALGQLEAGGKVVAIG